MDTQSILVYFIVIVAVVIAIYRMCKLLTLKRKKDEGACGDCSVPCALKEMKQSCSKY